MPIPLLFDISGGELLVILLFILIFFGSKGLPGIARTLGRTMRQVRDASAEVQREIQRGAEDVRQGFEEQRKHFRIEPPEYAVTNGAEGPPPPPPPSAPEPSGTDSPSPTDGAREQG